jgi:hypothetical protein
VFAVYSNRLGCVGSLALSIVGSAIIVGLMLLLNR